MSRKKKKNYSPGGTYALCITTGLILGLGLTPLTGNLPLMVVLGAVAGAVSGFLIVRKAPGKHHHRHHH